MAISTQVAVFVVIFVSTIEAFTLPRYLAEQYLISSNFRTLSICCVAINLVLLWLFRVFVLRLFFSPLRHLPGPKGSNYLLGEFMNEFSNPPGEKFRRWIDQIPNDGLLRYRTLFNAEQLVATSPAALKSILSDNSYDYQKPEELIRVLAKVIGLGLVLVEGDVHKFQRKHLLPSFRVNHIKQLYPIFWRKGCQLAETMIAEGPSISAPTEKGFEVEIGTFTTRATFDIIGIAGFGYDFNSLQHPEDELVQKYNWLLEPSTEKAAWFIANIVVPEWLISRVPWHLSKQVDKIQSELTQFAQDLVRQRRAAFKEDPQLAESKDDILSLLVKSNDFDDRDLAAQTMTMMAAGHETTSSALSWVLYLLSNHPDIQHRLRVELRNSLPDPSNNQDITAAEIDRLALLSAVCSESLRLFPTVPVTGRIAIRDTCIGQVRVPKGTFIVLSPWAINRSKAFWGKTAEEFLPERWINDDGTSNKTGRATSNYAQITFLHGPRSCIGQDFAQSELKCLVAALVGKFQFELARPDEGGQYTPAGVVTTKAAKGMYLHVKEIPGW